VAARRAVMAGAPWRASTELYDASMYLEKGQAVASICPKREPR